MRADVVNDLFQKNCIKVDVRSSFVMRYSTSLGCTEETNGL